MGAIGIQTHSVLHLRNLNSLANNNPKLGKQIFFPRDLQFPAEEKEIRLSVSCLPSRSDGSRRSGRSPLRRSSSSISRRGSKKEDGEDNDRDDVSRADKKPDSTSQEEIIAIFRRIQSSISSEDSIRYGMTDSSSVSDEKSPAASILKVLRGSSGKRQDKGNNVEENKRARLLTRKRSVPKKEEAAQDYPPPVGEFMLSRPPSNFVRRSPIPSVPRVSLELNNEISSDVAGSDELQLPKLDEMKVAELKDIAKARGIKGYSKLKKSDLISLLMP